jgi:hypothetical protein
MPITIIAVASPIYARADQSLIDVTATTDAFGAIPMTLAASDETTYLMGTPPAPVTNAQLFAQAAAGAFGPVAPYAPPPVVQLAAALVAAASAACAAVVAQIYPDPAHQAAFQNAASIVNGNGGAAPTAAPMAAKFAALAAVYGLSASAFAMLVTAMQGASFDLSAALAALDAAASAAATSAALATALTAFETAIAAVVAEINAVGPPVSVSAPAPIALPGVNA